MIRHALPLAVLLAGLAGASATVTPAAAAAPVCAPGFATVQKTNWLLKCEKTVALAFKGVALTEAGNAVCKTERYWNFGPKVDPVTSGRMVTVSYICGHVEG